MELTTEMLARFIGGQMEIQNQGEGYMFRGEIKTIIVEDNELRVRFAWMAKAEGYPPLPNGWVKEDNLDYSVSLEICSPNNIGPSGGDIGGDDRLCLQVPITGELSVLFPPNGNKLDPAKIRGLQSA